MISRNSKKKPANQNIEEFFDRGWGSRGLSLVFLCRGVVFTWRKCHIRSILFGKVLTSNLGPFLAHLSRRLKWTFLITICPFSVFVVVVNFSHFHLLLQNHWANFNQTVHKLSLGEGIQVYSKMKGPALFQGQIITKLRKNIDNRLNLLQNHWANFSQTWHKSSLTEVDSILFKWRALLFSKGR